MDGWKMVVMVVMVVQVQPRAFLLVSGSRNVKNHTGTADVMAVAVSDASCVEDKRLERAVSTCTMHYDTVGHNTNEIYLPSAWTIVKATNRLG